VWLDTLYYLFVCFSKYYRTYVIPLIDCNTLFPFSALTLLVGRQEGHLMIWPIKSWMLVCWWWRFDWSFARPIAPFVTTTFIIFSSNKIHFPTTGYLQLELELCRISCFCQGSRVIREYVCSSYSVADCLPNSHCTRCEDCTGSCAGRLCVYV